MDFEKAYHEIWGQFNYCPNCGYKIEWVKDETAVKGGE